MAWCDPSMLRNTCSTFCQMTALSSCPWEEWCGETLCHSTTTSMWTSTTSRWQRQFPAVRAGLVQLPSSPTSIWLIYNVFVCVMCLAPDWLCEWAWSCRQFLIRPGYCRAISSAASGSGTCATALTVSCTRMHWGSPKHNTDQEIFPHDVKHTGSHT